MQSHPTNRELRLLIVGDYLFEPKACLLSGPSGSHHICSRLAALLSCLVEQAGEVVDREYLVNKLWQDEPHSSRSLTQYVGHLRHYFDDTARAAAYIETVPGWGYRLVAPVYGASRRREAVKAAIEPRRDPTAGSHLAGIIQQFRERKVCRALLVYTIVIWLVFQVSEIIVPALNLPEWVNTLIVVLGLLGYPVAATLSWIFDLTPNGLVRESSNTSAVQNAAPRNRRDLVFDAALISGALVICGLLVFSSVNSNVSADTELSPHTKGGAPAIHAFEGERGPLDADKFCKSQGEPLGRRFGKGPTSESLTSKNNSTETSW